MAHKVKCYFCGKVFDRDKEPFVPIEGKKRYAHENCYNRAIINQEHEKENIEKLESYIKELFNYTSIPQVVQKQIKQYTSTEYNYSYAGILKALKYFYEVKRGDKEKAYGRIGIVPYVYEEAHLYYLALFEAKEKNERIVIKEYVPPSKEIHIKNPKREPMIKNKKSFSFLEDEEES